MLTPMLITKKSQLPKGEREWYNLRGKEIVVLKDIDSDTVGNATLDQAIKGTVVGTLGGGLDSDGDATRFFYNVLVRSNDTMYVFEAVSDFTLEYNTEFRQWEGEATSKEWHLKEAMPL